MPFFSILLAATMLGQAVPPARVLARALTANEISSSAARLDRSLVSGVSGRLHVEPHQSFAITASTGTFWLEPVLYESKNADTDNTSPRCGIFILKEKEKAFFLPTLGYTWTEAETCTDLEGVGFSDTGSDMPRILLLYAASSPNYATREPIVLDWNAALHQYQGNRELSLALTHHGASASIAAMKRRINELQNNPR